MTTIQKTHSNYLVNRSPIYYGWIVWGVATLGIIATAPGQSFSISIFIDHFIADFGIDRTAVSSLYGVATFIAALSLTSVGRRIDRHGNRLMGVIVSGLFALALIACSLIAGPFALFIAFIAIRGLGQGALGLTNSTVIAQWFRRRRGLMMSLTIVMFALFQSVYTPWLNSLLEIYPWQQVWIILGVVVGLIVVPVIWFLMRDQPEEFGLHPDGDTLEESEIADQAAEESWTLAEAMRSSTFWIFVTGRLLTPAWGTGLIFHQLSIFNTMGHSDEVALATYSQFVLISAAVSLAAGAIIDRVRPQRMLAFQLVTFIVTMAVATMMTEAWGLWVYAISFGIVMGMGGVFDGTVWANLFGRKHLGAIRGFVTTVLVTGTAIGPIFFGISFDYLGGYAPVLWAGVGLALIPLALSFFAGKPTRRPALAPAAGD
jgi:MFS family permease